MLSRRKLSRKATIRIEKSLIGEVLRKRCCMRREGVIVGIEGLRVSEQSFMREGVSALPKRQDTRAILARRKSMLGSWSDLCVAQLSKAGTRSI